MHRLDAPLFSQKPNRFELPRLRRGVRARYTPGFEITKQAQKNRGTLQLQNSALERLIPGRETGNRAAMDVIGPLIESSWDRHRQAKDPTSMCSRVHNSCSHCHIATSR